MITFLVTVDDDGSCIVDKMAEGAPGVTNRKGLLDALKDSGFETALIKDGDRIDMHIKVSDSIRRDLIITLLDDTVPAFSSVEEAETWMAARRSGTMARFG